MSEINKHITIPKNIASADDLDFDFLRKEGLEYIEKLSHNLWTDYNSHDPGITTLEMLCYALTDLGMRINMPIENILAPNGGEPPISEQFFRAIEIMPGNPVNGADYRKLFIDIKGVKNCWLQPYSKKVYVDCKNKQLSFNKKDFTNLEKSQQSEFELQGLYTILVDFNELKDQDFPTTEDKKEEIERLKNVIKTVYHANRNLCEDLVEIEKVETHPISICANIEVAAEVDEEWVHAKILHSIENYFSPPLQFYSLQQMLDKGYSTDTIFEGPVLENGFIDPFELEAAKLRKEVRLSDLITIIMAIEGVKLINDISITDCTDTENKKDEWIICVSDGFKPVLCSKSIFSYYKGVLPVNINKTKVKKYLEQLNEEEQNQQFLARNNKELHIPTGRFLNTNTTTTIQNDFPETYGIGENGLPERASTERKAQAKQLKAYLLFFDQIFATYFAHLGKVKKLLAVNNPLSKTYFTQVVQDLTGMEELINGIDFNNQDFTRQLLSALDQNIERKNQLLDHLIARFAEKFSEYTFLMKELYGSFANTAILNSKKEFLADYHQTSKARGKAFNYHRQPRKNLWNTDNISGVQKRIARLCGMKNYQRRNLSKSFVEIYDLINSDEEKVYRWHIKNTKGDYILSATTDYKAPSFAEEELFLAVLKIVESSPEIIEKAFRNEINDEFEIENFEIQLSENGEYSFDIINREAPPNSVNRIIARQFLYYKTQADLLNALLEIIDFMVSVFTEEGMFLLEHILLRPDVTEETVLFEQFMPVCTNACTSCEPIDPYSFRVSIILPGWTYRFRNPDFRNFMEELIRKELPAHILARICWAGHRIKDVPAKENDLLIFEKAYREFLFSKTNLEQKQNEKKLKELNKILPKINSIYPTGSLIDCDNEEDSLKGKIILGRTNIGKL